MYMYIKIKITLCLKTSITNRICIYSNKISLNTIKYSFKYVKILNVYIIFYKHQISNWKNAIVIEWKVETHLIKRYFWFGDIFIEQVQCRSIDPVCCVKRVFTSTNNLTARIVTCFSMWPGFRVLHEKFDYGLTVNQLTCNLYRLGGQNMKYRYALKISSYDSFKLGIWKKHSYLPNKWSNIYFDII